MTIDPRVVNPVIQVIPSQEKFSSTQLMTINGKEYMVFISSKTTEGKDHYHKLTQEHWNKILPCAQRVLLTTEATSLKNHTYTNLTSSDIHSVKIPLNNTTGSIRYQKANEEAFHELSLSEMEPLNSAGHHDMMKELRQTFSTPNATFPTYLSILDVTAKTARETALAKFNQSYPENHDHIHSLHSSLDKDISRETFEFYVKGFARSQRMKDHPITKIADFDVNTLTKDEKAFIPLEMQDSFFGIYIDPKNNQILVYNGSETTLDISKNDDLQKIIKHLKKTYPKINIAYSQAIPTKEAPTASQPLRHLILFLDTIRPNYKKFHLLHQQIQKNLEERCLELADKVQRAYSRYYERLFVIGKG